MKIIQKSAIIRSFFIREITILIFTIAAFSLYSEHLPTLAVLPVYSQGVGKTKTDIVFNYIIDQVNRVQVFELVERAEPDKVFSGIKLDTTAIVDEKTASKIRHVAGAKYIPTSSIAHGDGLYFLSMCVIETERATLASVYLKVADLEIVP